MPFLHSGFGGAAPSQATKFMYTLRWGQNMGGNRGIPIQIQCDEWEACKFIWTKCCKDKLPNEVREVHVEYNGVEFDPTQTWPRPSYISPL